MENKNSINNNDTKNMIGLLKLRVKRGINLAIRDIGTSDPYVVVTMANQKVKTRVIKKNCNPEWNEELTLSLTDINTPITLTVYDKDMFTVDDKMGDAEVDIIPYMKCLKMGLRELPNGCALTRVQPSRNNCLSDESSVVWNTGGKITQDMYLRLRNVETGELQVQIEFVDLAGPNQVTSR